jgi:hypothetical protein
VFGMRDVARLSQATSFGAVVWRPGVRWRRVCVGHEGCCSTESSNIPRCGSLEAWGAVA